MLPLECFGILVFFYDFRVLLLGLYIPYHAMLPSICPSEFFEGGGVNDPSLQ